MSDDGPAGGAAPDRLRELLDAVLAESHDDLTTMATGAHASPCHFARRVAAGAGESPVALRRRVVLERAAWRLRGGATVTKVAWEAGYDSVEGFSRAYARAWGHPPSATPSSGSGGSGGSRGSSGRALRTAHWLPAPNGIHFHSPTALWVEGGGPPVSGAQVTTVMAHHDVAETDRLLAVAESLDTEAWVRPRMPGLVLLGWAGPEESLALLLGRVVGGLEVWLAAVEGIERPPAPEPDTVAGLRARLAVVGPRWLDLVADVERRGAWEDRVVDALCEPPESFVLSHVLAHVLTYDAQRRGLARVLLRQAGLLGGEDYDGSAYDGDPIMWLRGG